MTTTDSQAIAAIRMTAQGMLSGTIGLLEGASRISALRFEAPDPDSPLFHTFRAVASETDHLPIGEARQRASPAFLAKSDSEMTAYLASAGPAIRAACDELLASLGAPH